jgi:hypothetical protein
VTRLALVRVPDDAPTPTGLIGWYTTRAPRRFAVITDTTAWTAWVTEHAPDAIAPCGHVDRAFEATVRKWVALSGTWTCGHCADDERPDGRDVAPDGMEARTDSAVRIHVTTPHGSIDSWESPVDVTPERAAS